MRVAFATFGCKINQYETEEMQHSVASAGNTLVAFHEEADIYVINTCSVTARSDAQCRQAIRAAARRRAGAEVVVTGCYAETRSEEIRRMNGVTRILANREKGNIVHYIAGFPGGAILPPGPAMRPPSARTRSFLKIQDGCDSSCSYCIVPLARGGGRSKRREEVVREFQAAVDTGCPEIVLTGIHIGTYGADIAPSETLTSLVRELIERRKGSRIRISSIEVGELTPELIDMLGHGLCRHLHIPLQSGDDRILRAMNRGYTAGQYRRIVELIAAKVPDVAIGTDVMVGFPGEGELEFGNTLKLLEDLPLSHFHVFSYSPRHGTIAAGLPEQVPDIVKRSRNARVRTLGMKKNLAFRKQFVGRSFDAVVERETSGRTCKGLTDNYIRTHLEGADIDSARTLISITITNVDQERTVADYLSINC